MDLSGFRDPEIAKGLIEAINATQTGPVKIMEVCGTHTVSIAKNGLRAVMPERVTLLSGPGCPVCVTANQDIDVAIELAKQPGVVVTTFGDMMKVPGSYSSLAAEKAEGRDVRIVYSPLDAIAMAVNEPDKQVVFVAVGFETTAPLIAAAILRAKEAGLENFSVFCAHKTVPTALGALVNDPEVEIDAFILPGHVSTIIGSEPYEFLAEEYHVPGVITGFEPVDVLQGSKRVARKSRSRTTAASCLRAMCTLVRWLSKCSSRLTPTGAASASFRERGSRSARSTHTTTPPSGFL
jgi:hydrogenase expression/formation protein HypD